MPSYMNSRMAPAESFDKRNSVWRAEVAFVVRAIVVGVISRTALGLVVGVYAAALTDDYVIQRADYVDSVKFHRAVRRFAQTTVVAFIATFAAIGPFVAAAKFGPWIRHAVFGLLGAIFVTVIATLGAAFAADQQPFNRSKGASSDCIDYSRETVIPLAILLGPPCGMLVGRWLAPQTDTKSRKGQRAPEEV